MADLALTGRSSFDLSLFSISSHSGSVDSSSSPKSPYPAVVAQDVLRADNDDTGIVYYFAIGSMMNKTSMKLRNLIPLSSEPGEILDYEIGFFGSGGFAEAKPSPGKSFHGVLHRMTTAQMEGLDRIECLYARAYANVRLYDGQVRQNCCVYQSNLLLNCSSQPPTQRYLELLIQGAEEHGVLSSYIDYLKTIPFIPRPLPHEFLALEVPSVVENTPHWTEEQLQEGDGVQDNPFYFAVNGKVVQYTGVRDESSYFFRISCAVALPGKHYEPAVSKNVYDPKYGPVKDLEDFTEEHCRYLEDMFVRNFMLHESSDSACLVVVARIKQFYRPDNPPLPSPSAVKCNAALTCDRQ